MTLGTHILGGALLAVYLKLPVLPAVFGAIFPDIDLKKGFPKGKRTLFNAHRGITHHILIPALLLLVIFYFKREIPTLLFVNFYSFLVGWISHLLLDMLTPLGVPFGLTYRQRFSLNLLKSSKLSEVLVVIALLLSFAAFVKNRSFDLETVIGSENVRFFLSMVK